MMNYEEEQNEYQIGFNLYSKHIQYCRYNLVEE